MANYYRITAYHPAEDLSVIADSNGKFEKLWEFSAYMVSKGFKVIAVSREENFLEGDMPKTGIDTDKITIQAYAKGKPYVDQEKITVIRKTYSIMINK